MAAAVACPQSIALQSIGWNRDTPAQDMASTVLLGTHSQLHCSRSVGTETHQHKTWQGPFVFS